LAAEDRSRILSPPMRHQFEPLHRDLWVTPHPEADRLAAWCAAFDREGLTPDVGGASAGNLSVRTARGFLITASRTASKRALVADDFVEVIRVEVFGTARGVVHFHARAGLVPSSDTLMHHAIYCARTDVAAVFHGHDPSVLAAGTALGVPVTGRETPYGSLEDASETARELAGHDYIIRKNHGFVACGRDLDHAGRLALAVHLRARALGF